jgi:glycerophosphoryl diester phosphodiesterase
MNVNRIIAHRGDNTNYPENSYAAIKAALQAGAHYVEFDLQMNADKTLIVFHDDDFLRMANNPSSVFETSDHQLKGISAHQPGKFSEQYYPTPIPNLDEVLHLFKHYPKARAMIEVKVQSLDFWGLETVMKKLLTSLEDFAEQAIVISYSKEALVYTQSNSTHETGLVFNQYITKHQQIANQIKPDYMICPVDIIPHQAVWKGSWQWVVYSINEVSLTKQLFKRGDIDMIETDDIRLLLNS